ncbi:uncharacterized protein LOC143179589 isoform X1 [Calliopsis andreniformis]|uniref:uncharacterized protein LOC143179589 isoform X1 n=1 Tax=Calliopsis andreniformis TaxID=337506 RepID=UPI003FCDED5A
MVARCCPSTMAQKEGEDRGEPAVRFSGGRSHRKSWASLRNAIEYGSSPERSGLRAGPRSSHTRLNHVSCSENLSLSTTSVKAVARELSAPTISIDRLSTEDFKFFIPKLSINAIEAGLASVRIAGFRDKASALEFCFPESFRVLDA